MAAYDIATALTALMLSKTAITDLVGSRIYSDALPQKTQLPAIVFWSISSVANDSLDSVVGLDHARIQIDVHGQTRVQAGATHVVVQRELYDARGMSDGTHIKGISRDSGVRFLFDRAELGSDQRRYIASQDWLVSYCSMESV